MLVPKDPRYANIVLNRVAYNEGFPVCRAQVFTPSTNLELKLLLQALVQTEASIALMNERLARRQQFSLEKAFAVMAREGSAGLSELHEYLARRYFFPTERELGWLLEWLDVDGDGKVSLHDLRQCLEPLPLVDG